MTIASTLFLMPAWYLPSLIKSLWEWQTSDEFNYLFVVEVLLLVTWRLVTLMNESQQRGRSDRTIFSRRLSSLFPFLSLSLSLFLSVHGGIVGGCTVAGPFVPLFWMGRISKVNLREEPFNSAAEFINVRIRISEASFTRQSYTMRPMPGRQLLPPRLPLPRPSGRKSRRMHACGFIGVDFIQISQPAIANRNRGSVTRW
jgi:hypothetical protein